MLSDQDLAHVLRELADQSRRLTELVTFMLHRNAPPTVPGEGPGATTRLGRAGSRPARPPASTGSGVRRSHTAASRLRALLHQEPDRIWSYDDLGRALPDVGYQTIRATMGRLTREDGLAECVTEGRYRLRRGRRE